MGQVISRAEIQDFTFACQFKWRDQGQKLSGQSGDADLEHGLSFGVDLKILPYSVASGETRTSFPDAARAKIPPGENFGWR